MAQARSNQGESLVREFAKRWHIEPGKVIHILTKTAFRQRGNQMVTNEQMAALMIVADQYGLNPFTGEIKAYPDKSGGIVPFVGIDGWSKMINRHEHYDGVRFTPVGELEESAEHAACWLGIECAIYRKDHQHPTVVTEWLDECYKPPTVRDDGSTYRGPWQTHTKRMLRHKALIQCARVALGFVGVYDEDEADRIIDAESIAVPEESGAEIVMQAIDPTPVDAVQAEAVPVLTDGLPGDAEAAELIPATLPAEGEPVAEPVTIHVERAANGKPIADADAEPPT